MFIVYLAAAIVTVHAEQCIVKLIRVEENLSALYNKSVNFSLDDLDEMFNTFHSLERVLKILNKDEYKECTEVRELLEIYKEKSETYRNAMSIPHGFTWKAHPFIVVSSVDHSERLEIIKRLTADIGGHLVYYPPINILRLKEAFDTVKDELKYAFYALLLYLCSDEATVQRRFEPVLIQSHWHNLLSTTLATHYDQYGTFPDVNSKIFDWPADLVKPDAVYYLINDENRYPGSRLWNTTKQAVKAIKNPKAIIIFRNMKYQNVTYSSLVVELKRRFNFNFRN